MSQEIDKIVIITHPLYDVTYHEKDSKSPLYEEHNQLLEKYILTQLEGIISQCTTEKNTHIIMSWTDYEWGCAEKNPKLVELLKKIPKNRLHEPIFYAEKSEEENQRNFCFFAEDKKLVKGFNNLEFSKEVELQTYGGYLDMCVSHNIKGLIEYLDGKEKKMIKIRYLGGCWDDVLLDGISQGAFELKDTKNMQHFGPYGWLSYRNKISKKLKDIKEILRNHSNQLEFSNPLNYKPKEKLPSLMPLYLELF
jgi:hypothetical protein